MSSRKISLVVLGLVLVAIALGIVSTAQHRHYGLRPLAIGEQTVFVSVADTPEMRERGLGGRTGLSADEGMLFIFDKEDIHPFWMKDMRFSIDILWLANDGTVIYIERDVSPDTYPQVFSSDKPARYVLELPVGYSAAHHIKVGDKVQL
jgi:uncharacterized protein